jgi:C1A family cysteine protease
MFVTPHGRGLGRRPDKKDNRDKKYSAVHRETAPLPAKADLERLFPSCFNQLKTSSCGGHAASALMCGLTGQKAAYSQLQIYWGVRAIENSINEDTGVECRDLFRVLQVTGAAPERLWPFDPANLFVEPTDDVYEAAGQTTIDSYSRLDGKLDYLKCLAAGYPFVLGFTVFESLDSEAVAKSGVIPMPLRGDTEMGGHAVLAIGYDTDFYSNPAFIASGLPRSKVSSVALKIRNSWGATWGIRGHGWLPIDLATGFGADAWTARMSEPLVA